MNIKNLYVITNLTPLFRAEAHVIVGFLNPRTEVLGHLNREF
jgi:hypothetical protein